MDIAQLWFALRTMPRNEKKVERLLRQKGYECITPTYKQKRRWSDRTVEIELPLFPTYVFCRLGSSVIGKAVSTPGVTNIVGFGGKPAEIEVEEIDALRLLGQSHLLRAPWRYLPNGTRVLIETGPLAGVQGVVCEEGNERRLVISITLLQRSIAIQLDEDTVVSAVIDLKRNRDMLNTESNIACNLLRRT